MRHGIAYILQQEPLILTGFTSAVKEISRITRPFTFLCHNPWLIRVKSLPRYLLLARSIPKHGKIHFITNEESEARLLRMVGLKADCVGQNLHIRENVFKPNPKASKDFDAVLASQILPAKRNHLAKEIKRLAVVTYIDGAKSWNLAEHEPCLAHAESNQTFLPADSVCAIFNRSACGLALSAEEGAMLACTEYLLAGLPVVTTPNRGGRNRYLGAGYSITVPPNAEKIRRAAEDFRDNPPDPEWIREKTLLAMNRDRRAFLEIATNYGGYLTTEEIWGGPQGIEQKGIPLEQAKSL